MFSQLGIKINLKMLKWVAKFAWVAHPSEGFVCEAMLTCEKN